MMHVALSRLVKFAFVLSSILLGAQGCHPNAHAMNAAGAGAGAAATAAGQAGVTASTAGNAASVVAGRGGESGNRAPAIAGSGSGTTGAGGTQSGAGTGAAGGIAASAAGGGAGVSAGSAADSAASAAALDELGAYLKMPRADRPQLDSQAFASTALTRADADQARTMLWNDYALFVRSSRMSEVGATESNAASLTVDGHTLRYYMALRGNAPATGRSLFISMHGGGNAGASTNDEQWNNQISLVDGYKPVDAIWVAPRAPSDDWNMWFTPEIESLFERLITDMIVFQGIDPNKVYINGYSAGGDGVYQLGPRMADHWAGAAMSAGHPNDASPLNLRNVPFAIHVGGDDTAYDRNKKAAEWGMMLDDLHKADPAGYIDQWQVHAGLPHWMNLEDAVAIPFVQQYTRNPLPDRLVWRQANVIEPRFYWLAVDAANRKQGTQVTATYAAGSVVLSAIQGLHALSVRFSDAMMDLDQPVRIELSGRPLFTGNVARTIGVIARTLEERGDPALIFSGETSVMLD